MREPNRRDEARGRASLRLSGIPDTVARATTLLCASLLFAGCLQRGVSERADEVLSAPSPRDAPVGLARVDDPERASLPDGGDGDPAPRIEVRIPLKYRRPTLHGQPAQDYALLAMLRRQLTPQGRLTYDEESRCLVVADVERSVLLIRQMVLLLDFSGLALPPELVHIPFRTAEEVEAVPNVPPGHRRPPPPR